MPLITEKRADSRGSATMWEQVPARLAERPTTPTNCIKIALVNNMPDAALEDTELQFSELIHAASGEVPVHIELYSLPGIRRGRRGQERLNEFYSGIDGLWDNRIDCAIITGTEPHEADLRDERYWPVMTKLFDWAEQNTFSAVLSCLAAHASVLHGDGVVRQAQAEKLFGVFQERKIREHSLTEQIGSALQVPHSRWNDIQESDLASHGYEVLTRSIEAGAGLFVKKKGKSLFVHFQGHPEYGVRALLKEYRRDIGRYLRRERQSYPDLPRGYFGTDATKILTDFRSGALSRQGEGAMRGFPEVDVTKSLQNAWRTSAVLVYRNWLQYVSSRKAETTAVASIARTERNSWSNSAGAV